jgi:hypothetical protein
MDSALPPRWYLTPRGRIARALLGVPCLAAAVLAFWDPVWWRVAGGVLLAYLGLSLPAAAAVQEPD